MFEPTTEYHPTAPKRKNIVVNGKKLVLPPRPIRKHTPKPQPDYGIDGDGVEYETDRETLPTGAVKHWELIGG